MPGVLTISDFLLENRVDLQAVVSWDPVNPGDQATASMEGDYSNAETWFERNGGVAFLTVKREGEEVRIETWGTDTNGDSSVNAIDIFNLPIDLTKAFPAGLDNTIVPSPHGVYTYLVRAQPGNPYAFRLNAGRSAPIAGRK